MQTTLREARSKARGTEPPPAVVATQPRHQTGLRKAAFWSAMVGGPALIGAAAGRLFGRRAGLLAGGVTALGLGGFRWQLQRLFNDEPAHELEEQIGRLEIRRLPARVEARCTVDVDDFERALELGFEGLAPYIGGSNRTGEHIAMSSPVMATHRLGFTVAFVMPPGRTRSSLPAPADDRILLSEAPPQRMAVLRFSGRYNADNVGRHEQELLRLIADAGLSAIGPVVFAGYDPPTTLPFLRRNELWVELER